jgi:ADP-ribose pyrophosphatase
MSINDDSKYRRILSLEETCLNSKLAYDGIFLKVHKDTVLLPDGVSGSREYIVHPGAVMIIPLLASGEIILERQFRYPLKRVFIEFPAGKIDKGEHPLVTAQRELKEETGYTAQSWTELGIIHNAIAYSDEHIDLFLAQQLELGQRQLDPGEFIELFKTTPQQLLAWIEEGEVTDVKTVVGGLRLARYLGI